MWPTLPVMLAYANRFMDNDIGTCIGRSIHNRLMDFSISAYVSGLRDFRRPQVKPFTKLPYVSCKDKLIGNGRTPAYTCIMDITQSE